MAKKKTFDPDNFIISPEEAEKLRAAYLNGPMREYVRRFMNDHPQVQTVEVRVSQYYNDEASDEVHVRLYPTVLESFWRPEPDPPWTDKKGRVHIPKVPDPYHVSHQENPEILLRNLPFVDASKLPHYRSSLYDIMYAWSCDRFGWSHWLDKAGWSGNGAMIPLFSAYCAEDSSSDLFSPLCVFRRREVEGPKSQSPVSFFMDMEMNGKKLRPEMDGCRPEYDDYGDDEDKSQEEKDYAFFDEIRKDIAHCEKIEGDPYVELVEHLGRRDLRTKEEDMNGIFLIWNKKGPSILEAESERIAGNHDALRELKAEWERRTAFDSEFFAKYGKG